MADPAWSRQQVLELLQAGACTVSFTKADGTVRSMRATLEPHALPITHNNIPKRSLSEHTVRVWDLDKQDWRSFRLDTIITISV
jgi:WYL_2, Sm-like SH3 beta-barrel fold